MFTVSASSSHSAERVYEKNTTPATATTTNAAIDSHETLGCFSDSSTPDLREGASERVVTDAKPSAGARSDPDERRDVVCDRFQALRRREIAEPQHELAATRVDEGLGLLRDLLDGADQVVAHVLVGIASPPQRAAAGRVEPTAKVGFGVKDAAIGTMGADDRVEVATDLVAVAAQEPGLAHEAFDARLPVRLVGVPRLDP